MYNINYLNYTKSCRVPWSLADGQAPESASYSSTLEMQLMTRNNTLFIIDTTDKDDMFQISNLSDIYLTIKGVQFLSLNNSHHALIFSQHRADIYNFLKRDRPFVEKNFYQLYNQTCTLSMSDVLDLSKHNYVLFCKSSYIRDYTCVETSCTPNWVWQNHYYEYYFTLKQVVPSFYLRFNLEWICFDKFFVRFFTCYYQDENVTHIPWKNCSVNSISYLDQFNIFNGLPVTISQKIQYKNIYGTFIEPNRNIMTLIVNYNGKFENESVVTYQQFMHLEVITELQYSYKYQINDLQIQSPGNFFEIVLTWGPKNLSLLDSFFGKNVEDAA